MVALGQLDSQVPEVNLVIQVNRDWLEIVVLPALLVQAAALGHRDHLDRLDHRVMQAVLGLLVLRGQQDSQVLLGLLEIEEPKVQLEARVQWGIRDFLGNKVHLVLRELLGHQELLVRLDLLDILDFKVHPER